MARILYQGHASFKLITDRGTVIYVDPFAKAGIDEPADLILVTHEHFDHNCVDMVPKADGCTTLRASSLHGDGSYGKATVADVEIEAVPACNANHPVDQCVGFVVCADGLVLYFAGDTSTTDFMATNLAARDIDYAFLPCDGIYNMDRPEAEQCARTIGARHTVPIHTAPTSSPDQLAFDRDKAEAFEAAGKVVMLPGETYPLG